MLRSRKDLVIVDAVRTPVGVFGGALRDVQADELLEIVFRAILDRTQLPAHLIDEVHVGCVWEPSNASNIGRVAALRVGIPKEVVNFRVTVNCASSLFALASAARSIRAGESRVCLVGGVESMSNVPYALKKARFGGYRLRHGELIDIIWESFTDPICGQLMGRTAENLVEEYKISREAQDFYALNSHRKAVKAQELGLFDDEIVPVPVRTKNGVTLVTKDEGPNPNLTLEQLQALPPAFKEGGTVTAGNSCGLNDAAAAVLLMSTERAKELGCRFRAYYVTDGWAGVEPERMGIGPVHAVPMALKKANLSLNDVEIVEMNEAFAAQALACIQGLDLDEAKLNLNGGGIALGHPVGATGLRLITTLLGIMERKEAGTGVATMCCGGGIGAAVVVERD